MNKLFNDLFTISKHSDERVQQQQTTIFAQAGFFAILIAVADMVVRGIIMGRPAVEWSGSVIVLVGFALFYSVRTIFAGLYDPNVDNEEKIKKKVTLSFFESMVMAIGIAIGTQVPSGFPVEPMDWFKFFLKLIIIFLVFFGYKYLAIKISWNQSNKDLMP
jgi:hypothetical protein